MVEFDSNWDQSEEFDDDLLGILDFHIESLEGDGLVEDWGMSYSQCLGPIPSNVIMGPPTECIKKIDTGPPWMLPQPVSLKAGTSEQQPQQLSNHDGASTSLIHQWNKLANVQDSGAFESQSPVSVLESSGSSLGGKRLSTKSNYSIPVRSRSKRVRRVGINPWLLASPAFPTSQPTLNTKRCRESKMEFIEDSPEKAEILLPVSDRAHLPNASLTRPLVIKKCLHCESTKTPQWREGPMGPKTLCNACGVQYRNGRLFPEYRPAASPSFVPSKHSNSHKKITHFGASASRIQWNKYVNVPETNALETQSPVSILENSGSVLGGESSTLKPNIAIQAQSRSKRARPVGLNPWLSALPGLPTSQKTSETKKRDPSASSDFEYLLNASPHRPAVIRKCVHCESTDTPQWREGPTGPLCNACGVQYRRGHLFPEYRPAVSPSFVPSKHSNSHRKVIEMRNKAKQLQPASVPTLITSTGTDGFSSISANFVSGFLYG